MAKRGGDAGTEPSGPEPIKGGETPAPSPVINDGGSSTEAGGDTSAEPEGEFIAREDLKIAGYGAPDRAVRSYLAALAANDVDAMADALIPEKAEEFRNLMSVPALSGDILRGMTNSPVLQRSGVRIVGKDEVADDEIRVSIRFGSVAEATANDVTTVYTLKRIAGDWKIADTRRAE